MAEQSSQPSTTREPVARRKQEIRIFTQMGKTSDQPDGGHHLSAVPDSPICRTTAEALKWIKANGTDKQKYVVAAIKGVVTVHIEKREHRALAL